MSNLRHWLWLSTRGPAPGMYAARLLEHFGTPEGAYFASEAAYDQVPDLPSKVRRALLDKDLTGADRILAQCDALDIRILTCQDAAYPQRLAQLDTAPCVLYVRGKLPQIDQEAAVAVVGARKASPYGVMAAGRMALDLARHGAVVVSGSAYGIDGAALRGALQGGGRVVSVLGNGIDVVYPPGHRDLYEDVAAYGALVSEYPPGTPPNGPHFPVRNRLIAGLSLGVLVVEGTQSSGSLITAKWALEQGRDVFAVPGQPKPEPTRQPLENETEEAPLPPPPLAPLEDPRLVVDLRADPEAFPADQLDVLRALQSGESKSTDDLVEETGLPARRVLSALTLLQVRQMVTCHERRFTSLVDLQNDEQA